jgi:hypothetical protein
VEGVTQAIFRERELEALGESAMERFVSQQNIERYRRLLDPSTEESERRTIFKLLAEEQEQFRQARETV